MFTITQEPIWFCPQPIDFRKQLDGLIMLVADQLLLNPASGQLFLFRDKSGRKIKILWWEGNGFWMFYKRLEKGRLKFPNLTEQKLSLTKEQFSWLLSGLNYLEHAVMPRIDPTNFY